MNNQQLNFNLFKENQEIEKKEDEKIICNDNENLYQYKFINKNMNNCNNIINKQNFCIFNNDTIFKNLTINSINNCNNTFVNLINKDLNMPQFCNYNNFSTYFNKVNYNCFNINNINCQINDNDRILFPKKKGNNYTSYNCIDNNINNINIFNNFSRINDVSINNVNIIQNDLTQNQMNSKNPKSKQGDIHVISKEKKISLEDFIKYINNIQMPIIEFVCNSKGAIELQKMLEKSGLDIKMYLIQTLKREGLTIIMKNVHGNYFFQKLIKKLNIQQKLSIYQIIEPEFLVIATNKCGTHSIQSLMDLIETQFEYLALNKLISKNMLLLFTDDNAYHIMMKMILDFPEEKRNILNRYLVSNIEKIIINCNGAFCVNKFITNNKNLILRKLLVENLKKNMKKLIFNKFSCINLLLVLQTFGLEWGSFVIKEIETNFIVLSENPISNVFISKVLEYLKNNNMTILKLLIWSLYKNIVLINYLISNKNHKKLLNQIIEYSDNEQKNYLLIMLKNSSW